MKGSKYRIPASDKILLTLQDINCQHLLRYTPTPVQEITDPLFEAAGVRVVVKREDLNHPLVSGNKFWKLKYNLLEAKFLGKKTLLTFGGAFSNHIYATAAAAHLLGMESIGTIRGEETLPLNPTLQFARQQGMLLQYVSREQYRDKNNPEFLKRLRDQFGDVLIIPEGGTNELAVKGVEEFAALLDHTVDYVCCAAGTGGTLAGLINGLPEHIEVIGYPVLKGGGFLADEIRNYVSPEKKNWKLVTDYHFGGYAKHTPDLLAFIRTFERQNNIPLDFVYTGKLFAGVYDGIVKGFFRRGSVILLIHSGGIQKLAI